MGREVARSRTKSPPGDPPVAADPGSTLTALAVAIGDLEAASIRIELRSALPFTSPEQADAVVDVIGYLAQDALDHVRFPTDGDLHVVVWEDEAEHHVDVALTPARRPSDPPAPLTACLQGGASVTLVNAQSRARDVGAFVSRPATIALYLARLSIPRTPAEAL